VHRPGKCCEECVSSKGNCLYDGTIRYHSEMWNSTRCDFCVCDEGQVTCQEAECAKVECAKVRKVFFFQDMCQVLWVFSLPLSFFSTDILRHSKEPALLLRLVLCHYIENTSQERRMNFGFSVQV